MELNLQGKTIAVLIEDSLRSGQKKDQRQRQPPHRTSSGPDYWPPRQWNSRSSGSVEARRSVP